MNALETTALGKRYRKHWALRDCSLRIPEGTVTALVGPNGAGKTTLLSLAVGLLEPTAGSIRVLGDIPANAQLRQHVGFVAQDTPLYQDFTAAEHVRLGRELNRSFDKQLATKRMEQLSIPLDRRVEKLSGGQRAQVSLAIALAKHPRLLLLDEPVASLDPLARREFLQVLMESAADDGLTVVISSHVVADLERVCDHIVVLSQSRVQVLGEVDDLLAQHKVLTGRSRARKNIAGVGTILAATGTTRQSTLTVLLDGRPIDPAWTVHDLTLEDVVIAYMADPSAGRLPGPEHLVEEEADA